LTCTAILSICTRIKPKNKIKKQKLKTAISIKGKWTDGHHQPSWLALSSLCHSQTRTRIHSRFNPIMLQDFSFCPCFGDRSFDDTEPDRDPVLLVSGIAGSILHSKKKNGSETRVWVRLLLADLEFKKKIWSVYNPKTGLLPSLND
jgi:hypothetical protein